ncbi:hypothetical protein LTR97_004052 [Elasticomyces elasticus]|uniref:Heterokaryon incompatibility domain-containing protein n=1 Tax=Elasticomyces elasticus TaxID=574655 RepID=A0AAN7W8T1_9PEZI|nr:hypothetical protein LTR97_004052 [Elasticomyces elasticus]
MEDATSTTPTNRAANRRHLWAVPRRPRKAERRPPILPAPPPDPAPNSSAFPVNICESCRCINLDDLLATDKKAEREDDWFEVQYNLSENAATSSSCPLCKIIFSSIHRGDKIRGFVGVKMTVDDSVVRTGHPEPREIREVLVRKCWGTNAHIAGGGIFRLYADEGTHAAKFVASRRAPASNLSETTLDCIQRWIVDCDLTHQTCRFRIDGTTVPLQSKMPTRVVAVGSESASPRLVLTQGQKGRYIALSHCWGLTAQVLTTSANVAAHQQEIPFHSLSATFRDAIKVTRLLGVEYIWIDSFCIFQDDKSDWLQESAKMDSVYENAYLTIAATSAENGDGGLEGQRPQSDWVRFPCSNNVQEGYMWFTNARWTAQSDLDSSPLNLRGWVFQERHLSRRIIHFAASQVYWECQECFVGQESRKKLHFAGAASDRAQWKANLQSLEHLGTFFQRRSQVPYDDNDNRDSPLGSFHAIWAATVNHYSKLQLTKAEDRLIALLGLAKTIQDRTGLRFIDGYWDDGSWSFVRNLAWIALSDRRFPLNARDRALRRCSSWSWAALDGPVDCPFGRPFEWRETQDCTLHLLNIGEDSGKYDWPCHPLYVSGMLQSLFPALHAGVTSRSRETPVSETKQLEDTVGWVCFDSSQDAPDEVFFSPLGLCNQRSSTLTCLVLAPVTDCSDAISTFRRVGVGEFEGTFEEQEAKSDVRKAFELSQRVAFRIV